MIGQPILYPTGQRCPCCKKGQVYTETVATLPPERPTIFQKLVCMECGWSYVI